MSASLHPSIFLTADGVPNYLYGIVAGIVVLVVVFVAMVGAIVYYYHRKNKVVIMKVSIKGGFYWVTIHVLAYATKHVCSYSVELGMMGSYLCIRIDYVDEVELLFKVCHLRITRKC